MPKNSPDQMRFENEMAKAKSFSDFLGFHARFYFAVVTAWLALGPAQRAWYEAFAGGDGYDPLRYYPFIVTFFFLSILAMIMLLHILRVAYCYTRIPGRAVFAHPISRFLVWSVLIGVETTVLAAVISVVSTDSVRKIILSSSPI